MGDPFNIRGSSSDKSMTCKNLKEAYIVLYFDRSSCQNIQASIPLAPLFLVNPTCRPPISATYTFSTQIGHSNLKIITS